MHSAWSNGKLSAFILSKIMSKAWRSSLQVNGASASIHMSVGEVIRVAVLLEDVPPEVLKCLRILRLEAFESYRSH